MVSTDLKPTFYEDTEKVQNLCLEAKQSIVYEYQFNFSGSLEICALGLRGVLNVSAEFFNRITEHRNIFYVEL